MKCAYCGDLLTPAEVEELHEYCSEKCKDRARRFNRQTVDGVDYICRGEHDKALGCVWERVS